MPAIGQDAAPLGDATTLIPPRSAQGEAYIERSQHRAKTDADYRSLYDFHNPQPKSRPKPQDQPREKPLLEGNMGLLVVLAGLMLGLFLWFRLAGGGLLGRAPSNATSVAPPDAWGMAVENLTGEALIKAIGAMPDRRVAMARVLRHALLQAARMSDTRFARADTERHALERLPKELRIRFDLDSLCRSSELANYGGRMVSEAELNAALLKLRAVFKAEPHNV